MQDINNYVVIFYILDLIALIIYIFRKFKNRKYIFSIFNINFFVFSFTLFIISPLQYSDKAWKALGYYTAGPFYSYINKTYFINLLGYFIFLLVMNLEEFRNIKIYQFKFIKKFTSNINFNLLEILFTIFLFAWFILYIKIIGTLDITGSNRNAFDDLGGIRSIYLSLTAIIPISMYFFIYSIQFKKRIISFLLLCLCIIIMLVSGNRSSLIFPIFNCILLIFYIKDFKRKNLKIFLISLFSIVIGIILSFLRTGKYTTSSNLILESILYGNTFSDIRDGAYVLFGYNMKFNNILFGKNYIADLISFIPSSYSNFRKIWSYGSFSTSTLFGMQNHYGLRGGWFLEPYINFGYIGVIVIGIIYGFYCSNIEKIFYKKVVKQKYKFFIYELFILLIINNVMTSLLVSSSFHNVYPLSIFMFIALIISVILPKKVNGN